MMHETDIYDSAGWMRRALEAERQNAFLEALYGKAKLWKGECGHVWEYRAEDNSCPICAALADRDRAVFALNEARAAHRVTLDHLQKSQNALWTYGMHKPSCAVSSHGGICNCGYFANLGYFGPRGWEVVDA